MSDLIKEISRRRNAGDGVPYIFLAPLTTNRITYIIQLQTVLLD